MCDPLVDVADYHVVIAHELMARIKVPRRSDREIFRRNSAARDPLVYARTARQIDRVVVETEAFARLFSFQHLKSELFVFFKQLRQIFLLERVRCVRRSHYRLYGSLPESEISHCEHVRRKVLVVCSVGAAHVVFGALSACSYCRVVSRPCLHKSLEVVHDGIVSAPARLALAHAVVGLSSAVHAQDDVSHLTVGEVDDIFIYEYAVGGQREIEYLVVFLLKLSAVGDYLLADVPVYERLSAKEVHFKMSPAA